ncbi:MAG: hypothetical protein V1898_04845 [Patescibacteria group bacterium]
MNINPSNLEQIFQNSHRKKVDLSMADKTRMFNNVLANASKQQTPKFSFSNRFNFFDKWRVLTYSTTAVTALALIAFMLFMPELFPADIKTFVINTTKPNQHSTNSNLNFGTIQKVAINIDTNSNSNSNESSANISIENNELAFIPRTTTLNLFDVTCECGGGSGKDTSTWKVSAINLSEETPAPVEIKMLNTFNTTDLKNMAKIFQIDENQFVSNHHTLPGIYLKSYPDDDSCLSYRYGMLENYFDMNKSDQCLSISDTGFLDYEQSEEYADADYKNQALNYIAEINNVDIDSLLWKESKLNNYKVEGDKEFDIFFTNSLTDTLIFNRMPWHVVVRNGKLVSLFGHYIPEKLVSTGKIIDLVSPQTAYSRILSQLKNRDENTYITKIIDLTESNSNIFKVNDLYLTYELAYNQDENPQLVIIPIYRMFLETAESENEKINFEIYIDPSKNNDLLNTYQLQLY